MNDLPPGLPPRAAREEIAKEVEKLRDALRLIDRLVVRELVRRSDPEVQTIVGIVEERIVGLEAWSEFSKKVEQGVAPSFPISIKSKN
jgi:hypothetical protein